MNEIVRQLPLGVRLPDRARFESFEPRANERVVEHLRGLAYGTIGEVTWLAGPAGGGKTHLLNAVCAAATTVGDDGAHAAAARRSAGIVPLAEALALGPELLEGRGGAGILCLDDVDSVLGDSAWELQLFRAYLRSEEQGGALVLSARQPPALVKFALPDLASRLGAAQVFQLRALDEAGQRDALRLRAGLRGLTLPDETLQYLQRRFPRDMRTLYQLLDTLDAAALEAQRRITVPFIREVLASRA
jgi:DnaA family protein